MALPMDVSRFMALSVSSIIMVLAGRYASRPLMSSPSNFATMPLPDLYLRMSASVLPKAFKMMNGISAGLNVSLNAC